MNEPDDGKEKGLLSDEVAGKQDSDEGHDKKISRYGQAKKRALQVSAHIISNYPEKFKLGDKVHSCGSFLVFWHYYTIGEYRLQRANFCKKHLFCGLCAILRAAKQLRSYLEKFEQVMEENPGLRPVLVTLTVKNGDDLMERFSHLQKAWKTMVQRRRNLLKASGRDKFQTVFRYFHGAVATYEFTNKGKGWHPHMHAICLVDDRFDAVQAQKELKREWEDLTKDSHQCDIRAVQADDENDMVGAFCEVFKYALKLSDMAIKDQVFAGFKLHRARLIASFGLLWGVKEPDDLADAIEEDLSVLPYVEMIYRYSDAFGYQLTETHHNN